MWKIANYAHIITEQHTQHVMLQFHDPRSTTRIWLERRYSYKQLSLANNTALYDN